MQPNFDEGLVNSFVSELEKVNPDVASKFQALDVSSLPRAGDPQRQEAVSRINYAYEHGYLDKDVRDSRVEAALRAKTSKELDFLVQDIPAIPKEAPPAPRQRPSLKRWRRRNPILAVIFGWVLAVVLFLPSIAVAVSHDVSAPMQLAATVLAVFTAIAGFLGNAAHTVVTAENYNEYQRERKESRTCVGCGR